MELCSTTRDGAAAPKLELYSNSICDTLSHTRVFISAVLYYIHLRDTDCHIIDCYLKDEYRLTIYKSNYLAIFRP